MWHSRHLRQRRLLVPALGLLLASVALFAGWLARPTIERRVAQRLESEARRRGLIIQAQQIRVGLFPPVKVSGLTITRPERFRVVVREAGMGLAPWGHGLSGLAWRIRLDRLTVSLPAGVAVDLAPSVWDLRPTRAGIRLVYRSRGERLALDWARGGELRAVAEDLRLSGFVELRRGRAALNDLGIATGEARLERLPQGAQRLSVRGHAREMRLASIAQATEPAGPAWADVVKSAETPATDAELELVAQYAPGSGDVTIESCRLVGGGATLEGRGVLRRLPDDPEVALHLAVQRVDFGRLLATAGLELPAGMAHFGSAALELDVRGRAREPQSFVVKQNVDFVPPPAPIPALERLKVPFLHGVHPPHGQTRLLLVGPDSPDFIALGDVPPLFLRALLLSEDAGFYGHHGLDFAEMPAALATNWLRGTATRGASTITQQLAKNLFLSRERSVSRKLSEAALALLLDATLSKERVLEIYLNVIEWGPDLYGLRPAARRYFGKEPQQLTVKEMAFLIALIPGPIKYQRSFREGTLSLAFESLVDNVLTKLRSVNAIDEQQYETALAETLVIVPSETVSGLNGADGGTEGTP